MDEYSGKKGIHGMPVPRKGTNNRHQSGPLCNHPPKVDQSTSSSQKGKALKSSFQSSLSGKEVVGSSSISSETSTIMDQPEILQLIPQPKNLARVHQSEVEEDIESGKVMLMEIGGSNTRSQRNFHQKFGLCGQEITSVGPIPMTSVVTNKYGLGCSSSNPNHNRKKDIIEKRNWEGEGSSASRNAISISDSTRYRNIVPLRDMSIASVRSQRLITAHVRGRICSQLNENGITTIESSVMIPRSANLNAPCFSYSRLGISSERLCGVIPVSPIQDGLSHSLINPDGFRRYSIDGVTEVLLALERIEHDGELTHEQILLLETNLLFNGLNVSDHHRDMRLDIDNMSYEELLALEDRMGTVSTALTEEALSDCLETSIYHSAPSSAHATKSCKDDIICCICQEEYVMRDEVGILQCQHKFHVVCIQQWMRLKNWCPICKVSAARSISSSLH